MKIPDRETLYQEGKALRAAYEQLPKTPGHKHSEFFTYSVDETIEYLRFGNSEKKVANNLRFLQKILTKAAKTEHPKLLCDTLTLIWYGMEDRKVTKIISDKSPSVELMKTIDKIIAVRYNRFGNYNFDYFGLRLWFIYENYEQTKALNSDTTFWDVVTYYLNLLKYKNGVPLEAKHNDASEHVAYYVENILSQHRPAVRSQAYHEHLEGLWVRLFTTTAPDGKRTIDPEYILGWENHPNWEKFISIATRRLNPLPVTNEEIETSFVVEKLLPDFWHVRHLFWFLEHRNHTTFIKNYLGGMSPVGVLEWAYKGTLPYLGVNEGRSCFEVLHRVVSTWAGITPDSDDKDIADVTVMVIDIMNRIRCLKNDAPGNILAMLEELPVSILEMPGSMFREGVGSYCEGVSTRLTYP